ncbi:hypothetical protein [Methylobacterium isbiliense]|uniref:Uncharacterized protein n=1 Tax=Methylobacterium isbiliense TaxID=315478 RepID=A0ABQ4SI78_9HYPH|nr:hypothetical protein [Methylobacterium isbiliense]MDN3622504.1 hypothetical protein [Methylobacterium isbiliense]GJE02852.1 hypothetical protein GMJLKIPL_4801 [Methylobacterium isbiliense]
MRRRPAVLLAVFLAAGLATPAAADWRYCLARGPAGTVYLSTPFSSVDAMVSLGEAFGRRLDTEKRAHDPVQCPRAGDAAALRAMREAALRFNRQEGLTVVEVNWAPDTKP